MGLIYIYFLLPHIHKGNLSIYLPPIIDMNQVGHHELDYILAKCSLARKKTCKYD